VISHSVREKIASASPGRLPGGRDSDSQIGTKSTTYIQPFTVQVSDRLRFVGAYRIHGERPPKVLESSVTIQHV